MGSTHYSCPTSLKLEFPRQFRKILKSQNSVKIRPVEAQSFHADRQADRDMTKLIVDFRTFAIADSEAMAVNLFFDISRSRCALNECIQKL